VLKRAGNTFTLILLATDVVFTLLAFQLATFLRETVPVGIYLDEPLYTSPLLYLAIAVIWAVAFLALDVYNPARALRYIDDVQAVVIATTIATLLFAGVAYLFFRELSRLLFFYFYMVDLLLLALWRGLARVLLRVRPGLWPGRKRNVLIVGAGPVGFEIAQALQEQRWTQLEPVGFVDDAFEGQSTHQASGVDLERGQAETGALRILGPLSSTAQLVRSLQIDEVIIALPLRAHERLMELVVALQELPVNIRLVPDVLDLVFIRASVEEFAGLPLIGLREPAIDGVDRLVKRCFDLVLAGTILVLFSPLMLLTALAIKLDTPGPALYCGRRVGEGGRLFWMLKFRTMMEDAEEKEMELAIKAEGSDEGPPIFDKRPDDPRVTRMGHILRRTSLDEMPQLVNVLKGEMSLVGPRPELPWLVQRYLPWQRKRFAVPQGMTGWWQVNGRSSRGEHHQRVEDDLYYIRNYSLLLDLRILWKTIGSVIRGEGAF
jgi:exopolysaccharide biosynthesis polyprenyl glycosylphosphotransferase